MSKVDAITHCFKPEDCFVIAGRGMVFTGPSPLAFSRNNPLGYFDGLWLISHPKARKDCFYRVKGVEQYALHGWAEAGTLVGLLVEPVSI